MGDYTSMSLLDEGMVKTMLWRPQSFVTVPIIVNNSQRSVALLSANLSRHYSRPQTSRKVVLDTSRLHVLNQ